MGVLLYFRGVFSCFNRRHSPTTCVGCEGGVGMGGGGGGGGTRRTMAIVRGDVTGGGDKGKRERDIFCPFLDVGLSSCRSSQGRCTLVMVTYHIPPPSLLCPLVPRSIPPIFPLDDGCQTAYGVVLVIVGGERERERERERYSDIFCCIWEEVGFLHKGARRTHECHQLFVFGTAKENRSSTKAEFWT